MAAARRVALSGASAAPARRRRWRYLPLALLGLMTVEVLALWWLVSRIGLGWVLVLALIATVVGAWLIKREGPRAWRSLRLAVREGRVPAPEAVHGVLVLVAGLLMLLPGLISDVLAIVLLLPPVSAWLSRRAARSVEQRVGTAFHRAGMAPPAVPWGRDEEVRVSSARGRTRFRRTEVVEGEIIDD